MELQIGKQYDHYKGGRYQVLHLAKLESTGEPLVIYKSIYMDEVYARPLSEWHDKFKVVGENRTIFELDERRFLKIRAEKIPADELDRIHAKFVRAGYGIGYLDIKSALFNYQLRLKKLSNDKNKALIDLKDYLYLKHSSNEILELAHLFVYPEYLETGSIFSLVELIATIVAPEHYEN